VRRMNHFRRLPCMPSWAFSRNFAASVLNAMNTGPCEREVNVVVKVSRLEVQLVVRF